MALVTGASSGIGRCTVPALARRGFTVVATMRNPADAGSLETMAGVSVHALDVLDPDGVLACVDDVVRRFGRVDVLVNNAGVAVAGFVEEASLSDWRSVFETNVFGQATVTNAVLGPMRAAGRGHVVMMSSVGGRAATPLLGVYCASKFALEGYAETLRLELAGSGVAVSLVEPGSYRTAMYDDPILTRPFPATSPYAADFERLRTFYVEYIEHGLADPDEVARCVARLAASGLRHRPPLRRPVGRDAWLKLGLRAALPWDRYERTVRRMLGLTPAASTPSDGSLGRTDRRGPRRPRLIGTPRVPPRTTGSPR